MAISTHTLTGDISALVGEVEKAVVTIHLNTEDGSWVNDTDDVIRLGGAVLYNTRNGGTGQFTAALPTSTGTGLQYEVRISYIDVGDRDRPQKSWRSGWFSMTADANLADKANDSTLRINKLLGDVLADDIAALDVRVDALEADGGTGEALAALADRLDGVNDHGNVSGTLTLDPANGFHIFDATGPLEISLGDPPGYSVAFKAITGADDVTIDGLDDLELTDDAWATFVHYRSSWHLAASGASGGGDVEPVLDPPTQPGTVTVDPTADGYNLSWVASTVAAGYEVQIDGGAWVDSGANLTHAYTGLTAGSSHSGAVRAYNSGGERSDARSWGPSSTDTLGLHEQILSYDPSYYLRLSQGSIQDHSATPKVWAVTAGNTAPVFDGPALAPGDIGSARWPSTSQLSTSGIDFGGMDSFTLVALVRSPDVAPGAYGNMGMADVNIGWDFESYSRYKPNETHIVFVEWEVSYGGSGRFYFDTDTSFSTNNINRSGATTADVAAIYAHGNEFGPGANGGFASYLAILPNVLLDASQRLAMATAAGRA